MEKKKLTEEVRKEKNYRRREKMMEARNIQELRELVVKNKEGVKFELGEVMSKVSEMRLGNKVPDHESDLQIYEEEVAPVFRNIVLKFGKYNGKNLDEIVRNDFSYFRWLTDGYRRREKMERKKLTEEVSSEKDYKRREKMSKEEEERYEQYERYYMYEQLSHFINDLIRNPSLEKVQEMAKLFKRNSENPNLTKGDLEACDQIFQKLQKIEQAKGKEVMGQRWVECGDVKKVILKEPIEIRSDGSQIWWVKNGKHIEERYIPREELRKIGILTW